jgi:hypothetical protein
MALSSSDLSWSDPGATDCAFRFKLVLKGGMATPLYEPTRSLRNELRHHVFLRRWVPRRCELDLRVERSLCLSLVDRLCRAGADGRVDAG